SIASLHESSHWVLAVAAAAAETVECAEPCPILVEFEHGAETVAAAILSGAIQRAIAALDHAGKGSRAVAVRADEKVQVREASAVRIEFEDGAEFVGGAVERAVAGLEEGPGGIKAVGGGGGEVDDDFITAAGGAELGNHQ